MSMNNTQILREGSDGGAELTESFFEQVLSQRFAKVSVNQASLVKVVQQGVSDLKYSTMDIKNFEGLFKYDLQYSVDGENKNHRVFVKAKCADKSFASEFIARAFDEYPMDWRKKLRRPLLDYFPVLALNHVQQKEKSIFLYAMQDARDHGDFYQLLPEIFGVYVNPDKPLQYIIVEEDLSDKLMVSEDLPDISCRTPCPKAWSMAIVK